MTDYDIGPAVWLAHLAARERDAIVILIHNIFYFYSSGKLISFNNLFIWIYNSITVNVRFLIDDFSFFTMT